MNNLNIKAGSVDVSVVIRIIDSTDGTPETGVVFNTAGIDLQYRRELAASVAITEATLAALTTAHTDGGFLHIGNGYYRLDLPDAAVASGAAGVLVHGTVTGMVVIGCYIQLVAYDPFEGAGLGLTNLNATISSRASQASLDVVDDLIDTEVAAIKAKTDNLPAIPAAAGDAMALTAAAVDAIWDEDVDLTHQTAGTAGKKLDDAGAVADPWAIALPGAYGAGTAGKIVGDNINATVSSRSSHSAADVWTSATRALTDKAGFSLSASGIQAVWDALTSALTVVGSIGKLLVDNINAAISSRASQASLDVLDDFVDTEVAAIKAKTDALPAAPAATGDAMALTAAAVDAIWDESIETVHQTAGTAGKKLDDALTTSAYVAPDNATITSIQADTNDIQARLPAALVGGRMDSSMGAIAAGLLTIKKNVALSNFEFLMIDSTDHVTPKTGLAITAQRSIDGGAFAACTNTATEVGNGVYKINLSAADLNGDVVALKFTGTGADQTTLTILTQA